MIDRKKLSVRLIKLLVSFFILDFVATKFYLYFSIWYFDMIMHLVGGAALALFVMWLFSIKVDQKQGIFTIILGVLILGIGWEAFEFVVKQNVSEKGFNFIDTFSDLCFDLAGGLFALVYFTKGIMKTEASTL